MAVCGDKDRCTPVLWSRTCDRHGQVAIARQRPARRCLCRIRRYVVYKDEATTVLSGEAERHERPSLPDHSMRGKAMAEMRLREKSGTCSGLWRGVLAGVRSERLAVNLSDFCLCLVFSSLLRLFPSHVSLCWATSSAAGHLVLTPSLSPRPRSLSAASLTSLLKMALEALSTRAQRSFFGIGTHASICLICIACSMKLHSVVPLVQALCSSQWKGDTEHRNPQRRLWSSSWSRSRSPRSKVPCH